jgi:hypothetical protein
MSYWKINCMADKYPGLWQTWFIQQTVAIGWPPPHWKLIGGSRDLAGWAKARAAAVRVKVGDSIIVQLSRGHVGRIGTVTAIRIADHEWKPTVPEDGEYPQGEMGRRFEVRWDLSTGPVAPSAIAKLPEDARFKGGNLRYTISPLSEMNFRAIELALADEANWTVLNSTFRLEKSLSDYIGSFPYLLSEGLRPYPKAREYRFKDGTRIDVLLLDRQNDLVLVECKQDAPTVEHLDQVQHYVKNARSEIVGTAKRKIRAILVHGGSRNVEPKVRKAAKALAIELVRASVVVDFASSV